ncbi:serine/threonine-protein kinase [Caldimonas caldifontis]|uniref:non-specific serine/threonine protein kinase n=1 Tax=Caldimonas caldifontis TaxID=1452508 RepID=A0A2S5SW82_9BURK|nr:serine/threonine-protein kinase [Caldimonas caldifontis]PPE66878.1 serine/threonine protein kinase [Caldimonas caldifontis]
MEFQKTIFALTPEQARAQLARDGQDSSHHFDTTQQHDTANGSLFGDLGERTADPPNRRGAPVSIPPDELPTIGHIGRYALKYRLGEGGLGAVYAAQDPLLSRLVAIKTLGAEMAPEARERFNSLFLNEARAVASLNHPHIVTVFDAGTSPQGAYIAMELLKGKDLRQLIKEGWRPKPVEAAQIVRRAADALAYAHAKGIIHRDVKPANIFMTGRTQPKVLDFGIARVASQQESGTEDDFAAGSPYYMAPEQVRHDPVDRRCDVYSLGVVLYELLTGVRPFQGATLSQIAESVLTHQPPLIHELNPSVPQALSLIAARAMEKDPDNRYRSARALSRELRHWIEEQEDAEEDESALTAHQGSRRLHRLGMGLGGVAVLAAVTWAVVSWWGSDPGSAAPVVAVAESPPPAPLPVVQAVPADAAGAPAEVAVPTSSGLTASPTEAASRGLVVQEAVPADPAPAPTPAPAPEGVARERRATPPAAPVRPAPRSAVAAAGATLATGEVVLAISPWGQVEVNGAPAGIAPPLNRLTLTEGRHTITIRNDEFPPHRVTITVTPGQPVTVRHKFGS